MKDYILKERDIKKITQAKSSVAVGFELPPFDNSQLYTSYYFGFSTCHYYHCLK